MNDFKETSQFEVMTINEVKIAIDREIVSEVIIGAMNRRQYEHVEARVGGWLFDTDEIQPDQTILEIGAGLGFVGSSLSKSGKVKEIISYEANPKLLPLIRETHRLNGVNSEVRNILLGEDDEGTGSLFVPEHFWAAVTGDTGKGTEYLVPKASFKNALQELEPTFLLIDIDRG
jgi:hypothetical protein